MKKITLLLLLLSTTFCVAQINPNNLIIDPGFETTTDFSIGSGGWESNNNNQKQRENGTTMGQQQYSVFSPYGDYFLHIYAGAVGPKQDVTVKSETNYTLDFYYSWLPHHIYINKTMTVKVRNPLVSGESGIIASFELDETEAWNDGKAWAHGNLTFEVPEGVTEVRIDLFKDQQEAGTPPVGFDNVQLIETASLSTNDLSIHNFSFYPNPSDDFIQLSASNRIELVEIHNLLGQKVLSKNLNNLNESLNIEPLKSGIYIMTVKVGSSLGSYKIAKN